MLFRLRAVGLFAVGLIALGLAASWPVAAQPARQTSVRAGVYSLEQIPRGQQQYDVFCAGCHGPEMEGAGVDVPALADQRFARKWSGRTLRDLFDLIKATMPENAPNTLTDRAYADLLAFILQGNGFPPGAESLDPDRDWLGAILFEAGQ